MGLFDSLDPSSWLSSLGSGISDLFSGSTPTSLPSDAASAISSLPGAGDVATAGALPSFDYSALLGGATPDGGVAGPSPALANLPSLNTPSPIGQPTSLDSFASSTAMPGASNVSNLGIPAEGIKGLTSPPAAGAGSFLSQYGKYALPAAAVGMAALKSNQPLPGVAGMKSDVAALRGAAPGLMAPLTSGAPLPGAVGQSLMASRDAQIASIRSNFARMGMSGSSMEEASIAAANQQYAAQTFSQAQSLYSTGLQTLNQADSVNSQIIALGLQQDAELTNALASVAGGFASGAAKSLFS